MPLITEGVKDIVGKAKLGLFQAHAEDLRLKWIILGEIPKARLQEETICEGIFLFNSGRFRRPRASAPLSMSDSATATPFHTALA